MSEIEKFGMHGWVLAGLGIVALALLRKKGTEPFPPIIARHQERHGQKKALSPFPTYNVDRAYRDVANKILWSRIAAQKKKAVRGPLSALGMLFQ